MRIVIATDAWAPQVNGVVRTLGKTTDTLRDFGHEVEVINPQQFRTIPCPTYPSIGLAVLPARGVANTLDRFSPQAVHIATEGPIGHAARSWCIANRMPFTTSFHTQFPELIRARAAVPVSWTYAYLRRFHGGAARTMVPTESQRRSLDERGFRNLKVWSRGVDTTVFRPRGRGQLGMPRPVLMYMGRVAVEKNIEAFLELDIAGNKVVVGDGPDFNKLKSRFSETVFTGAKFGEELARHLSDADVFVFPSRTDTFGLVLIEAMACGVPVAAYPVTGPIDVVKDDVSGALNEDLEQAVERALELDREACVREASAYTWTNCSRQFESYLAFTEPLAQALSSS